MRVPELPLLWHIPFSHFNEKARWALDFKRIPHQRRVLGANYLFKAWRATGRGTLPILFLDGKPIGDSTAIIAALEQWQPEPALYPQDPEQRRRALELEDHLDEVLGPSLRAALVTPLFREDPELALRVLTTGMPAKAFANLQPLARIFPTYYRFRHRIEARRLDQDRANVTAALERIARELQPGGYLVGNEFSVADLTAAALLAPALQPAELQYPLAVALPDELLKYQAEVIRHPAGQWALGIYHRHRGVSAEVRSARASAPAS
jgi:glutathione S-transferase